VESAPRSSRFTRGVESTSRKVRNPDLPEKCRGNVIPLSPNPSRSAEDFTPDFAPEHQPLTLPLRVRSHKIPGPTDKGWRLPMKRSASMSDLPSLSVSDEDEDEPLEKKVKLVSVAHPVEMTQPVSVCRALCPLVGRLVTHWSRLIDSLDEVSQLPPVTSYPIAPHLSHPVPTCNTGCVHLPRLSAAVPLQLPQVLLGHLLQEASECGGCGLGQSRKCSICCEACVVSNLHRLFSLLFRTVLLLRAL
jgi:hypothetical protein